MPKTKMVDFESMIYDRDTLISEFTNRPVTDMDPKKYVFWCGICKMKLNTPHWAIVHLGGRVHREKLIELNPDLKRGSIWKNGMQLGCKRYYGDKSPENNRKIANGKLHENDDEQFRDNKNDTVNRRFSNYSNHSSDDDGRCNGNGINHSRNGNWDREGNRPNSKRRSNSKDRFSDASERNNRNHDRQERRLNSNCRSNSKDCFPDTTEMRNNGNWDKERRRPNSVSGRTNENQDRESRRPNLKRRSTSEDCFSDTSDISDENSKKMKGTDGVNPNLICAVCDRFFTTPLHAIQHFRGKRHALNVTAKIEAKKKRWQRNSSPINNSASPNEFRNRFEPYRKEDGFNERNGTRYREMDNVYEKRNVQNRVNDLEENKVSKKDRRTYGNQSFNDQRDERPRNGSDHWTGDRSRRHFESSSHKRNQEENSLNTMSNRVKRDYPYNRINGDDRTNNAEKTKQGWQNKQDDRLRGSNSSYRTRVQDSNLSAEVAAYNSYQQQTSLPSKISKNDRNDYIYGQDISNKISIDNNALTKSKYEQTMNQLTGLQNGLLGLLNGNSSPLSLPAFNLSTVYPSLNIPVNNVQYEKHR